MGVPPRRTRRLTEARSALHRRILGWYRRMGRDLPWRRTRNAWRILVSEVMLQQTQVPRVLERYPAWLRRFPTPASLAAASPRDALIAWSGMGYNRRALYLHAASRLIVQLHRGRVPDTVPELRALPGVGANTTHAVLCFAYRARLPVIDVNVRRVLTRLSRRTTDAGHILCEKDILPLADSLLPARAYFDWNQALMDLGALICTARAPHCDACPASPYCSSAFRVGPAGRASSPSVTPKEIPRRIHRGRILEFLRHRLPAHATSFMTLGRALRDTFSDRDAEWLRDILASLERDGMIEITVRKRPASVLTGLPAGPRSITISLPRQDAQRTGAGGDA
jgi:A/G-specific adenine glycosylase